MLNKVCLIGNLGKDPESRVTHGGKPVVNFSMATSDRWTDKQTGEKRERTEWHNIVCFNEHLCKIIEQYVFKGSKIYIEGKMQTRKWEKDGIERYSTEVVLTGFDCKLEMLDSKRDGDPARESRENEKPIAAPGNDLDSGGFDDEIPF